MIPLLDLASYDLMTFSSTWMGSRELENIMELETSIKRMIHHSTLSFSRRLEDIKGTTVNLPESDSFTFLVY